MDGLCEVCGKMKTTGRDGNSNFLCTRCSNDQYYEDLAKGERAELKIKWADYKPGFKEELRHFLATNKSPNQGE